MELAFGELADIRRIIDKELDQYAVQIRESLGEVLSQRLGRNGSQALRFFDQASEVVIFGSMSAGLERPDSDMDVLCIGGDYFKLKSKLLDLIVVPLEATKKQAWLQSELATHVGAYGTWITGRPYGRAMPTLVRAQLTRSSGEFLRS